MFKIVKKYDFQSKESLTVISIISLAALQIFISLKTRAAGTTIFETFCMLTAFTMMIIGTIKTKDIFLVRVKWCFIGSCVIVGGTFITKNQIQQFNPIEKIDQNNLFWEIHKDIISYRKPIIMVIPDNSFTVGSVEELLLKGFSDFPTWNISRGQELLNHFAPMMKFRTNYGKELPEMPYPSGVVIAWFEKAEISNNNNNFRNMYPELNNALVKNNAECKKWTLHEGKSVNVCSL